MRIKEITIRGFRGFNKEQTISLDSNLTFVYGLNGSGKSSLVEALEWLFFGEISRRLRSSCKSEYMTSYLRNIHYSEEQSPFVEVLIVLNGEERRIRKELIGVSGYKFYIDGVEAEDLTSLNISFENSSKPILSQGEIKRFVDTEPKDRWEEVSSILGIEIFGIFRADLLSLRNSIENDEIYIRAKNQQNSVITYFIDKNLFPNFLSTIRLEPFIYTNVIASLIKEINNLFSSNISNLFEAKTLVETKGHEILRDVRKPKGLEFLDVPEIKLFEKDISNLSDGLKNINNSFSKVAVKSIDRDYLKFLHIGLSLIKGISCPFCEEETLTEAKKTELIQRLHQNKKELEMIEQLEVNLNTFSNIKEGIVRKIEGSLPNAGKLKLSYEELLKLDFYREETGKIAVILETELEKVKELIQKTKLELDGIEEGFRKYLHGKEIYDRKIVEKQTSIVENSLEKLLTFLTSLIDSLKKVKESIISKSRDLSPEEKSRYELYTRLIELIEKIHFLKIVGIYNNHISVLRNLITQLEQFEKSKAGNLLAKLSSDIQKYYNKLNPNEPIQFKEIAPTTGKLRQAKLKAEAFGKEINPVTSFSEAHMNSLGLSLYFPQRVDYNPEWEFIMLDDPIPSMDDAHSNQLIDILREHANNKQIIVLSHSSKFCEDFEIHFGKENLLRYEFTQGDENGPKIALEEGPIRILLDFAQKYSRGNKEERKTAGNNLRRAVEKLLAEYLIGKGQDRNSVYRLRKDELFKRAKNAGLVENDLRDLESILSFADPASHGHDPKDIETGDLEWGIQKIKDLSQKLLNFN